MKNKLMIISGIFLLLFLGNISAEEINLQAGDSYIFDLKETYEYYTIEGNKTQVDLNITQNETIVIIAINKYMQPDSFEITFFDKKGEVIDTYSIGGGSSSSYWECGEWSECINKTQERVCEDIYRTKLNRTETKKCFPSFIPFEQGNETGNITDISQTTNFLTGAVTGIGNFAKSRIDIIIFISLIGILIIVFVIRRYKLKQQKI